MISSKMAELMAYGLALALCGYGLYVVSKPIKKEPADYFYMAIVSLSGFLILDSLLKALSGR